MIIDARQLPQGETLDCDICIVGAGAAGISLAHELRATSLRIIVLESGGLGHERGAQELCRGQVAAPRRHPPVDLYRRRQFGGTTAIWGGRCLPLDSIDFEPRPHVPLSGWPISRAALEPYYERAMNYCEAGVFAFTAEESLPGRPTPMIPGLEGTALVSDRIDRFSLPTHFGKRYRRALDEAGNVRILLHATAAKLIPNDAGNRVARVDVRTLDGKQFAVGSSAVVLAAGGLETTRLTLLSNGANGTGWINPAGHLGRHYMCHIEGAIGILALTPGTNHLAVDYEKAPDGAYCRRYIWITPEAQRSRQLMNFAARPHYPSIVDPDHGSAVLSAMYMAKGLFIPEYARRLAALQDGTPVARQHPPWFWLQHLGNLVAGAGDLAPFGFRWLRSRILARRKLPSVVLRSRDNRYMLDFNAEQAPNPDSRVMLGSERDGLGLPCLRVDWRMCEADVQSIAGAHRLLRDEFARSGCGRLLFDDGTLEDQVRASMPVGGHHIGTARMAATPSAGVVDADCRVFGVDNLYLASSAVFPTCGFANPTLTIVALALRLADLLKRRQSV